MMMMNFLLKIIFMMSDLENIFYYKRGDLWVLKTGETDYHPYASLGEVIFVGNGRPLGEQVDDLLDLILMKNEFRPYYIEILTRIMAQEE